MDQIVQQWKFLGIAVVEPIKMALVAGKLQWKCAPFLPANQVHHTPKYVNIGLQFALNPIVSSSI